MSSARALGGGRGSGRRSRDHPSEPTAARMATMRDAYADRAVRDARGGPRAATAPLCTGASSSDPLMRRIASLVDGPHHHSDGRGHGGDPFGSSHGSVAGGWDGGASVTHAGSLVLVNGVGFGGDLRPPAARLTDHHVPRRDDAARPYCRLCQIEETATCAYCLGSRITTLRRLTIDKVAALLLHDAPGMGARELVSRLISYGRNDRVAEEVHSRFKWRLSQDRAMCGEHKTMLEERHTDKLEIEALKRRVAQVLAR